MKNLVYLVILLITSSLFAQRKPKIKGNKNVIEKQIELSPFSTIQLNDDLDVTVVGGSLNSVSLLADENLMDVLKFKIVDSTLIITSFYKITSKKKLNITIHNTNVSNVIVKDGKLTFEGVLQNDNVTVATYGSSKLILNASAPKFNLEMYGNSSGDLNIETDSLNIGLKDKSKLTLYTTNTNTVLNMSGGSDAKLIGSASFFNATLVDKTNVRAENFKAIQANVNINGSSLARVLVQESFDLSASGTSKTYFHGTAKIHVLNFDNLAEIYRRPSKQ